MKKSIAILLGMAFCLLIISCPQTTETKQTGKKLEFDYASVLTVTPGESSLICAWTSAYPFPENYDLYYVEGNFTDAARVKAQGRKIKNCIKPNAAETSGSFKYTIKSLSNSKVYSVVVTAKRTGYVNIDSAVLANQQPSSIQPRSLP